MAKFEKALDYVLQNEGGFSNNPNDFGGATQFGITQATLSNWLKHPATVDDVKSMTKDVAAAIYAQNYWHPLKLDQIEYTRMATCIFDMAVNMGLRRPVQWAQVCCNTIDQMNLEVDGVMGPKTIEALNYVYSVEFIQTYSALAWGYYLRRVEENPSQAVFLKGWTARAKRMLTLLQSKYDETKSGDLMP